MLGSFARFALLSVFFIRLALAGAPAPIAVPASFTAAPPERYRALDSATRDLLARSVYSHSLEAPDSRKFKGATLWQFIDERMPATLLATVVQIRAAAEEQGIAASMTLLREIYAGSSWGVSFYGDEAALRTRVAHSDFCHDLDAVVRPEHGNTQHTWWRHLGLKAGLGALHLGISDGAGYNNLHFDTTNPAVKRGSFGSSELCSYSLGQVLAHNADLRTKSFSSAMRDYLMLDVLKYFHKRLVTTLAGEMASSPAPTALSWSALLRHLQSADPARVRLIEEATEIAMGLDAITRFHSERGSELAGYQHVVSDLLLEYVDLTLADGRRSGYFEPQPAQHDQDYVGLMAMRDRISGLGALDLNSGELDWIVGVFYRVREHLKH